MVARYYCMVLLLLLVVDVHVEAAICTDEQVRTALDILSTDTNKQCVREVDDANMRGNPFMACSQFSSCNQVAQSILKNMPECSYDQVNFRRIKVTMNHNCRGVVHGSAVGRSSSSWWIILILLSIQMSR